MARLLRATVGSLNSSSDTELETSNFGEGLRGGGWGARGGGGGATSEPRGPAAPCLWGGIPATPRPYGVTLWGGIPANPMAWLPRIKRSLGSLWGWMHPNSMTWFPLSLWGDPLGSHPFGVGHIHDLFSPVFMG